MTRVKDAKCLFPLKLGYLWWLKIVFFRATLDSPQGHLGCCWVIIW